MEHSIEAVIARNEFYHKNYKRMLFVNLFLFMLLIAMIAFGVYQRSLHPVPKYFPTTPDGRLISMPPVNIPHVNDERLKEWSVDALLAIQSLDYVTYRRSLQEIRQYFTSKGHRRYLDAFGKSNNLTAIKTNSQVVSAEIEGEPNIIKRGVFRGHYAWKLTVPCRVYYENSANNNLSQGILATITVLRVSVLEHPSGLAINDIVLEARLPS